MPRLLLLLLVLPFVADADEPLTVAVASNFLGTTKEIVARFSDETGIPVRLSSGSTGKLYAQIVNGAPFDVFLAADAERPDALVEAELADSDSKITYAIGQLVLYSADSSLIELDCRERFLKSNDGRVAIANPETAPFGRAARQFLVSAGLWESFGSRLVTGENVMQAMTFVRTSNAEFGFVPFSALFPSRTMLPGCTWPIPPETYDPIEQQAVVVAASKNPLVARQFVDYLQSPTIRTLIKDRGYEVPGE